ncbi:MAG: hypothetical protein U0892_13480 [Pirellulales bacterium]
MLLGHRAFIIDGTTITLAPTEELAKAFPPASNQHGESVWPVAQLLVAHELQTGCAVVPQIDPMYGPNNVSEAKQPHVLSSSYRMKVSSWPIRPSVSSKSLGPA